MPENGGERPPDPRVAFASAAEADAGERNERPGAADRAVITATADEHLPPLAEQALDDRPLTLRFTEPEE
ncbi:hypothetical protein [Streptosporangium pseudovulgare]|uniref:Uncharacterized protein n=1 Tax=Streptosporangium pseudovulgare TaxID=35765 RepID=A0ABQ2QPT9_9ACTN|nr:hypothetical protein [Streptosporangium pseudovulgare]GGP90314.1 hypothetical protein GCM10010140_20000 [Streptosporangium pseudovulgare]